MCGRQLDPPSGQDHPVARMKDLLCGDHDPPAEDPEETPRTAR